MILQSVYRLLTLIYLMSNENLIRDIVQTIYSFSHAQSYISVFQLMRFPGFCLDTKGALKD